MRLRVVTVGKPKLAYAKIGWDEYLGRIQKLHTVRITQLADKYANNVPKILEAVSGSYVVALEISGIDLDSRALAKFLSDRELETREVSFLIGGPDGLPQEIRDRANYHWSLSRLTLPHDLAMVVTLEALFRASSIKAGLPYHR